jgi:dTDP-4-dehydrorhamnose reductase
VNDKRKKILLLGSSGWVAHYIIPDLIELGFCVIGISNNNNPKHDIENYNIDILDENYITKVKDIECDIIINMLHAKDYVSSFQVHCEIANYCKTTSKHYTYMSSSNAVDGDVTRDHYEYEEANGASEYGMYKAKCEHFLYKEMPKALIIRFPATHGYAPNRTSRTEEFLSKLHRGESISCYTGVMQGRPYVGHLSKMITKAISEFEHGIFHMSATTSSDEVVFLKSLAKAFGYSEELVVGDKEIKWNMTIVPQKIFEKYGDEYRFSEKDTIAALANCSVLSKYLNSKTLN